MTAEVQGMWWHKEFMVFSRPLVPMYTPTPGNIWMGPVVTQGDVLTMGQTLRVKRRARKGYTGRNNQWSGLLILERVSRNLR